ncbi:MAG: hypothetical protein JG771_299, partial [Methermicoccus sp.]|nr:hypothetical protein [Methermicoccus sp.]
KLSSLLNPLLQAIYNFSIHMQDELKNIVILFV